MAVAGVLVLVVVALAWLNRRVLAREALTGWLESRGVPARARVERLSPDTFTAQLSIGDPKNPDFAAERADVRYRMGLKGLEILSVTLRKPVLRAQLRKDGLHVGALDPLVKEFTRRPPRPDATKPRILIDDGLLVLSTDYGPVRVAADARVEDGQLQALAAASAPVRLRGQGFDVTLGAGRIAAARGGGGIGVDVAAPVTAATFGEAKLEAGRLGFTARVPYPDFDKRRGEGPVTANLTLTGRKAEYAGQGLDAAELSAAFTGRTTGWVQDLAMRGQASASLRAGGGRFQGGAARTLRVALTSADLAWTRKGGDRVAGTLKLNGAAQGLDVGDLTLTDTAVTASGPVSASAKGVEAAVTAALVGRGAYAGLGAPTAEDAADMAAIKRAARGFRIAAPAVSARLTPQGLQVGLPQPVRLSAERGGVVTLAARGGAPLFGPGGGAFRLTVAGGGLPSLDADVARLEVNERGVEAQGRVRARGAMAMMRGGEVDASGRLQMTGGGVAFSADRCVAIKAARLEFDANDVTDLSGRLCPAGGPVFAMKGAAWRVNGRAEGAAATIPFAQTRLVGGAGQVSASGAGPNMGATIRVSAARVEDTAAETRFEPLALTGDVTLREFIWRADMAVWRPSDMAPLGTALITHDGRLGLGVAVIETATLSFEPNGLQPTQLSPLAGGLAPPVTGQAQFSGRFDWSPAGATSSGKLTIPSLDFGSPAGPVKGLKGEIAFESLAPLKAAAGQELTVAEVQGPILLTGLSARFELIDNLLKVEGGEAAVGGGRARVETLEVPLVPGAPTRGILFIEGVQLHDLVEASPFGDKVELDAKVSGRVPFEVTGSKVRISGGELKADQAGRLSIDRAALTGVQAGPEGEAPAPSPNDTFTDFAYQAMENLAFDTLSLSLASREDGRLGMLFQISGRHDPPQKQQIRLSVIELIQQKFLGKKLPLPSGTGVNLTLDTTINLDDLLGDWAEYQRVRSGSAAVQP